MKRRLLPLFGLLVACVQLGWAAEPNAEQSKAVVEIQQLGGRVTMDEKSPGKPVIAVELGMSRVTDAGLENLRGLTELRWLHLSDAAITDAGLEHLSGLTRLETLNLENTKVTDTGLEQLKGLTQLQRVDLTGTKVSDEGVKKLQEALPNCEIVR